MKYGQIARQFCEHIRELASKPDNMDNFENYLSCYFGEWLGIWANTPESITGELRDFAQMEI